MTTRGTALFSSGGARNTNASKALVEFRAGKMNLNGTLVTPDKRRGQVMIEQGDDQLMHFKWKDRSTGQIEDDLIIFPDDVEFKKVPQCTTGRVFILKFKSTTRKLFFWMQEPKDDKDEEFCKKVNDYLNNPPAPGSSGSRGGGGSGGGSSGIPGLDLSNLGDSELQSLLSNMSQQQLMQLFGGGGIPEGFAGSGGGGGSGGSSTRQRSTHRAAANASAAATASPASTTSASATSGTTSSSTTSASSAAKPASSGEAAIRLEDLQNVLSGLPAGGAGSSGPSVDLSSGLTAEVLQPLLENEEFVKKMKALLPEEEQAQEDTASEVRGTLHSPQFRQAVGMFSSALQTGKNKVSRFFQLYRTLF